MSTQILFHGMAEDMAAQFPAEQFGAVITEPSIGNLNLEKAIQWVQTSGSYLWRLLPKDGALILITNPVPGFIRFQHGCAVEQIPMPELATYPDRGCPFARPVDAIVRLINRTQGTILDPYAGSCSTLLAARKCGRDAVGIEKNHVQVIAALPYLLP
jgi:hypothetical protein